VGKNILYWADQSSQGRIKVSCTGMETGEPNEPTKEGPLSFVLFEVPFALVESVSTVSRDHRSVGHLKKIKSKGPLQEEKN
jgi:hypothetical protein